jgi:protein-L-isoaspartate(D-aspartate) O-methyltransferase
VRYILSFGVFAILASAVLMTPSNAQQEAADRERMVEEIDAMLASAPGSRGVARLSPRVRAAMTEVPRREFVPPEYGSSAYRNTPLPIGHGQTISQPLIVALMTELLQLEKTDKVLEVGTGWDIRRRSYPCSPARFTRSRLYQSSARWPVPAVISHLLVAKGVGSGQPKKRQ